MIAAAQTAFSFLKGKWEVVSAVLLGVFFLFRGVSYIENSAIHRENNKALREAMNRQRKNREYIDGYKEKVAQLNHQQLIERMLHNGELRPDTE